MKAFLLAGGLGERLRPFTDRLPKCLVPINGVPLLSIWLDLCRRSGIDSVLINVSRHADALEEFLRTEGAPVEVCLVREPQPLGNAGTVLTNRDFVQGEDDFFVLYSDNLTDASLPGLLAFHRTHDGPLTIGLFRTPSPTSSGIVVLDPGGRVRRFDEKPDHPEGNLANAGIYVARQSVFDAIPRNHQVTDFAHHVFPALMGRMYGDIVDGYLLDIGTPGGLAKARIDWAARTPPGDQPLTTLGESS